MTEQDRINANKYHFSRYEAIYNAKDLEEAKNIALGEMKIIHDDMSIENDTKKELVDNLKTEN